MSEHPQVVTWAKEYTEVCGTEPPTKFTGKSPMPLAEAIASTTRPTLPPLPLPLTPASTTSLDRVEDRSDASSTGSSGTYFSSLRSSYNKLRLTSHEPVAQGSAPSLPSLKSCGLLEPWARQPQPPSQQPAESGMPEASSSPTPPWIALRTTFKDSTSGPSDATTSPSTLSRSSKSTMPVGLDWLANEP
jgi:hypothetical protein